MIIPVTIQRQIIQFLECSAQIAFIGGYYRNAVKMLILSEVKNIKCVKYKTGFLLKFMDAVTEVGRTNLIVFKDVANEVKPHLG